MAAPFEIDVAIAAHRNWRKRLEWAIEGTGDKLLDPARIQDDTACVLGGWIFGQGGKDLAGPLVDELIVEHRKFHQIAAEVVRLAHLGRTEDANYLINGAYTEASHKVIELLEALRPRLREMLA